MADASIETPRGSLRAHVAVPSGSVPVPGVVVLHEMFGLTPEMRAHADRLAGAGYLAAAPDLYSWGNTARCIASTMLAMQRGTGRALEDIEATRAFVAGHERCTGTVGVVGFCMGGGLALVSAPRGGFAAAAPNYGMVPRHAESALEGICPVVASYGADDWMVRGHPERLERALDTLGVPHEVKVYPGATHGFMNRHPGTVGQLSERLLRLRFDPDQAEDAWSRILGFFAEHLRSV